MLMLKTRTSSSDAKNSGTIARNSVPKVPSSAKCEVEEQVKKLAILLGTHAVGTITLAVFPDSTDLPFKHIIHDVMSAISYLPLLAGILISRKIFCQERALKVIGILGLVIILINLPMPLINVISPLRSISGLLQRLLAGSSFFWLTLTFLILYRKYRELKIIRPRINSGALVAQPASKCVSDQK